LRLYAKLHFIRYRLLVARLNSYSLGKRLLVFYQAIYRDFEARLKRSIAGLLLLLRHTAALRSSLLRFKQL